jgi:hypothetical protein
VLSPEPPIPSIIETREIASSDEIDGLLTMTNTTKVRDPLVTDVALAALALGNSAVLCTIDRDFKRIADLEILNPIEAKSLLDRKEMLFLPLVTYHLSPINYHL